MARKKAAQDDRKKYFIQGTAKVGFKVQVRAYSLEGALEELGEYADPDYVADLFAQAAKDGNLTLEEAKVIGAVEAGESVKGGDQP